MSSTSSISDKSTDEDLNVSTKVHKKCTINHPICLYNSTLIAILVPIVLLPIIVIDGEDDIESPTNGDLFNSRDVARFGYTLLVMGIYWITECIPIAATSLLPYIFYPLFGIRTASDVAKNYMKNTNFLLLGGLMVAVAIESSGLHKRIALGVLKVVGSSPRRLMLGFMLIGWFLSMWISNTASTAMTIPIALAVLSELRKSDSETVDSDGVDVETEMHQPGIENRAYDPEEQNPVNTVSETQNKQSSKSTEQKSQTYIEKGILLCVPYACSIGGTATLTGTAPNLVLQEYWTEKYPESPITLNYTEWLGYNFVNSIVMLICMFIYMNVWFIGFRCKSDPDKDRAVKKIVNRSWKDLGAIRQEEVMVLISFIVLVILWFFRKPGFIPGWASVFPEPSYISDGVPAILIGILLFLLPANKTGFFCGKLKDGPSRAILNWKQLQHEMQWGVLLLIGGGYAMADGSDASGFSIWIANLLQSIVKGLDTWVIALIVSIFAALFTEICSNTAAASLFIPILSALAGQLCIHPLYLMLPATLACSLSFMLPAATPPNAIAFGSGKVSVFDMIKSGAIANIIGIVIINLMMATWGTYYFDLSNEDYKVWANDTMVCTE